MAKYYATVAGLPNLGVEDRKLPFSSTYFAEALQEELTKKDRHLLNVLRLEEENRFLVHFLENKEEARNAEEQPSLFNYKEVECVLEALQARLPLPKSISLPPYMVDFLKETQIEPTEEEQEKQKEKLESLDEDQRRIGYPIHLQDKLSEYYYKYALGCGNRFVESWSRFNLSLRNILAAHIGKELGWNITEYIVGDSPLERKLKASANSQLSLDENDLKEINKVNAIIAEDEITRRERLLDQLRWEWLEEATFDYIFDIEAILCYYLRLRIVERWTELNEEKGEATFREIVASLKKESNDSLEEFKKNQKR